MSCHLFKIIYCRYRRHQMVTSSLDSGVLCFSKSPPTSLKWRIQPGHTITIKNNIPGVWFEGGVVAGMTARKQGLFSAIYLFLIRPPQ